MAIPSSLFVRNGSDRYLARQALGDLYPREFQDRQKGSDDPTPDFLAIAERDRPHILKEIGRLETNGRLKFIFDFARMRETLSAQTGGRSTASSGSHVRQAIRAFTMARFIEWNDRDNRP
ncbi:MAG: asparagine synthase-related protein [Pseudolabrys sp.]